MDHHIANCKAKVVFSSEKAKNKNIKEYPSIRKKGKDGSSESRSVLREEEWERCDNSLHSLESILFPTSKLKSTLKHKNQDRRKNSDWDNESNKKTEFMYDDETKTIL
jgi:hypothetical protein